MLLLIASSLWFLAVFRSNNLLLVWHASCFQDPGLVVNLVGLVIFIASIYISGHVYSSRASLFFRMLPLLLEF